MLEKDSRWREGGREAREDSCLFLARNQQGDIREARENIKEPKVESGLGSRTVGRMALGGALVNSAARTAYHRLGDFKQQTCISRGSGGWDFRLHTVSHGRRTRDPSGALL